LSFKFQVNLGGLIDLLSNHLYTSQDVFVRELLQNAVDAISARKIHEPDYQGKIEIEVTESRGTGSGTLTFIDNGVGLTEEEVHLFLATIGQTSKNAEFWERPTDFLGQFGIGLLACFIVADEVVVMTRSYKAGAPTIEWRGNKDGTYSIRTSKQDIEVGTQVYIKAKAGCEQYFNVAKVHKMILHFGQFLPYPIYLTSGDSRLWINEEGAPWRQDNLPKKDQVRKMLDYGNRTFGMSFFDCIPLSSPVGDVDGVAYVLPYAPSSATKRKHRVYLKNMLLSEGVENLVPEWAFFVKCIINANDLRPTASRESFYEDDKLVRTREQIGQMLRGYLIDLAINNPMRLQHLIALHGLSIKALAVEDDEFYKLFIKWLPFQTSAGELTLAQYRQHSDVVRYVTRVEHFRQIAPVAQAEGMVIVNASYVYDAQLMVKYTDVFPDEAVEKVDPESLAHNLEELTLDEQTECFDFLRLADVVLRPFQCGADMKKFNPEALPTLYSNNASADALRSIEQSKKVSGEMWSAILDTLALAGAQNPYSQLIFNHNNALVRKVARMKDKNLLQRTIEMLYVQALLLGHHPLSIKEMTILNQGLLTLIDASLVSTE